MQQLLYDLLLEPTCTKYADVTHFTSQAVTNNNCVWWTQLYFDIYENFDRVYNMNQVNQILLKYIILHIV